MLSYYIHNRYSDLEFTLGAPLYAESKKFSLSEEKEGGNIIALRRLQQLEPRDGDRLGGRGRGSLCDVLHKRPRPRFIPRKWQGTKSE